MMRAVLYARVSSDQQAEKDLSIPSQLRAMREHAEKSGWQVVQEFVDEALSGKTTRRPDFKNMITLAKQKPKIVDVIIVWKFSRFARNREDSIVYKSLLRKAGVQVFSLNEKVEDSPSGRLLEGIIESMDEFYSDNLAQDTRRGMKEAAQRGYFYGGRAPLGYKAIKVKEGQTEHSRLVIDPVHESTVRKIFDLSFQGHGGMEIAKILNGARLLTASGKLWGKTSIYSVLNNSMYTGNTVYNRTLSKHEPTLVPDTHAAYISLEQHRTIKATFGDRRPKEFSPRSVASPYLLSGLVRCAECGATMTSATGKGGTYKYYGCSAHKTKGSAACRSLPVPKEKFETAVLECLKEDVLTPENLLELVELLRIRDQEHMATWEKEKDALAGKMQDLNNRKAKLMDLLETSQMEPGEVRPRLSGLNEEIEALLPKQRELAVYQHAPSQYTATQIRDRVWALKELLAQGSLSQTKALIRSFVKRITVSLPQVEIEYTLPLKNDKGEPRLHEVLLLSQIGSLTWTRTRNPSINSRMLHH